MLKDRVSSTELRERLGLDDIILLQWYWHVLQKEDNDWMKKCMVYEVEGQLLMWDLGNVWCGSERPLTFDNQLQVIIFKLLNIVSQNLLLLIIRFIDWYSYYRLVVLPDW